MIGVFEAISALLNPFSFKNVKCVTRKEWLMYFLINSVSLVSYSLTDLLHFFPIFSFFVYYIFFFRRFFGMFLHGFGKSYSLSMSLVLLMYHSNALTGQFVSFVWIFIHKCFFHILPLICLREALTFCERSLWFILNYLCSSESQILWNFRKMWQGFPDHLIQNNR